MWVLGTAVLVATAGCRAGTPVASPPSVSRSSSIAPAPATRLPSTSATPSASATPARQVHSSPRSDPRYPCRVTVSTLDHAPGARLPVDPHSLLCWHNWAIAEPLNPPGDGSYLFRYTATGGWRFYAEGSAFECADLGIQVDPNDPPPFCG